MKRLLATMVFGVMMGLYRVAFVYVVETSMLRSAFHWLYPACAAALISAFLWPAWFDRETGGGWLGRLGRRVVVIAGAAVVAGTTAVLIVSMWPGYIAWEYDLHYSQLLQSGKTSAAAREVLDAQRQTPRDFFKEGVKVTIMQPGCGLAVALTIAAGGMTRRSRR